MIPQYEQWRLKDNSQPTHYVDYCYVISIIQPSPERVEKICTICQDWNAGTFKYQADTFEHGTVYWDTCAKTYVFIFDDGTIDRGWHSDWFRPYMIDNIRTKPRCPSCDAR